MTSHWEYKTLKLSTENDFWMRTDFDSDKLQHYLNALGGEGWELVSVFDIEQHRGGSKFVIAVMKRQKA